MKVKIKLPIISIGLAVIVAILFTPLVNAEIIPKETAILVIDVHNDVLDEKGALAFAGVWKYAKDHNTIANIAKAIGLCEKKAIPVIRVGLHFHHGYPSVPDRGFSIFFKEHKAFLEGTWGAENVPGLKIKHGQIEMGKKRFSSFYGTELDTLLRGFGTTTLIICGVSAHACVNAAIVDAVDRDYNVIALKDCIAGPEPLVDCAFKLWSSWKVKVITLEEAFAAK